jgi:hypothetical protein
MHIYAQAQTSHAQKGCTPELYNDRLRGLTICQGHQPRRFGGNPFTEWLHVKGRNQAQANSVELLPG